jgi:hypothetical protein
MKPDLETPQADNREEGHMPSPDQIKKAMSLYGAAGEVASTPAGNSGDTPTLAARKVMRRYTDAYLVGEATVFIATIVKGLGILVAALILLAAVAASDQVDGSLKFAIVGLGFAVAAIFGGVLYILGILLSAQASILRASLDSAVNSSPFLTDEQRSEIMSL